MIRTGLLLLLLLVLVLAGPALLGQEAGSPIVKVGFVDHPPINEMSGIVKSRTFPDVWWVLNDSGDVARIFAIDGKGTPIVPPFMADGFRVGPAPVKALKPGEDPAEGEQPDDGLEEWPGISVRLADNMDWEDITLAGGKLYLADVGNNGNARRDLGVYVLNEPNPRAVDKTRTIRFLPVRFPDQAKYPAEKWHFDCEAVFHSEGKLYFLTKHRVAGQIQFGEPGTKLYRLDSEFTDRENVLTLLQSRADMWLPTAADLSPDGNRLAVLTAMRLWVFEKPKEGDLWLSGEARRLDLPRKTTKQAEGVCWDDDATLRLCNEQRDLFTVKLADLEPE